MTPEQALNLLYRATRMAPLNADDHDACKVAAQTLSKAIQPPDPPKAEETPEAKPE